MLYSKSWLTTMILLILTLAQAKDKFYEHNDEEEAETYYKLFDSFEGYTWHKY